MLNLGMGRGAEGGWLGDIEDRSKGLPTWRRRRRRILTQCKDKRQKRI